MKTVSNHTNTGNAAVIADVYVHVVGAVVVWGAKESKIKCH